MASKEPVKFKPFLEEITVNEKNSPRGICRICLEANDDMISVCRCMGSVNYVHESCIKTWILAKEKEIDNARCELCGTKLEMTYNITKRCSCGEICQEKLEQTAFSFAVLLVVSLLSFIVYLLISNFRYNSVMEMVYDLIIIGITGVGLIALFTIAICSFRRALIVDNISDWQILPQNFEDKSANNLPENFVCVEDLQIPSCILASGKKIRTSDILKTMYPIAKGKTHSSITLRGGSLEISKKKKGHNRTYSLKL